MRESLLASTYWAGDKPDNDPATLDGTLLVPEANVAVAAAATQVRDLRLTLAPQRGLWPDLSTVEYWDAPVWAGPLVRVGGKAAISDARVKELANALPRKKGTRAPAVVDLGGSDPVATSVAIAKAAYPDGARTAYLANAAGGVDAAAATSLLDGPVLLVPSCGALPASVKTYLAALKPRNVIALGSTGSVCDGLLDQAAAATRPMPRLKAVDVSAADLDFERGGGAMHCALDTAGAVRCWGEGYRRNANTWRGWRAPHLVPELASGVKQLAGSTACAVTSKGALLCPEEGRGGTVAWRPVRGLTSGVVNGGSGTCVLTQGGVPWCLELDTTPPRIGDVARPTRATRIAGVTNAVQVAGTAKLGCARHPNGTVRCWGIWSDGPGKPARNHGATPMRGLPAGIVEVDVLEEGTGDLDGTLRTIPQLVMRTRDGRAYVRSVLARTDGMTYRLPNNASKLAADGSGCHITRVGSVTCDLGKVGSGTNAVDLPALVQAKGGQLVDVSIPGAYAIHGIAVRKDGTVVNWDTTGRRPRSTYLGDGSIIERETPAEPLGFDR